MITNEQLALQALSVAEASADAGISRLTAKGQVERYLALRELPYLGDNGKPNPYCAAFVAWCLAKGLAQLTGNAIDPADPLPTLKDCLRVAEGMICPLTASVGQNIENAKKAARWVPRESTRLRDVKPGWVVCFEWAPGQRHTGFVLKPGLLFIQTVEGNTSSVDQANGGAVWRKTRAFGITGFIRTY